MIVLNKYFPNEWMEGKQNERNIGYWRIRTYPTNRMDVIIKEKGSKWLYGIQTPGRTVVLFWGRTVKETDLEGKNYFILHMS